jgi:hypothetical protein
MCVGTAYRVVACVVDGWLVNRFELGWRGFPLGLCWGFNKTTAGHFPEWRIKTGSSNLTGFLTSPTEQGPLVRLKTIFVAPANRNYFTVCVSSPT